MQFHPILKTAEMIFEIHGDDFRDFSQLINSKQPPVSIPANYRVTAIENTGYIPEASGMILIRVRLQFVDQQSV